MALCFIFGLGCNSKSSEDTPLPLIADYIVDSVYLPITESDRQKRRIKEVARGQYAPRELIAFVRDRNYKLYTYDMESGVFVDSLPLDKFRNEYTDFCPVGIDSVYVEQSNNVITRLFNGAMKTWNVRGCLKIKEFTTRVGLTYGCNNTI